MKEFIINYNLINIKKKLVLIYLLNIFDILFTIYLLKTKLFIELNPLMKKVVTDYNYSFFVKGILPAILFIYIYIRIKKANIGQLKKSNHLINGIGLLYILINIMHIVSIIWYLNSF